jgi:hypothetical protein
MSQSGVKRHKMYEHPVPVSPFEEKSSAGDTSKDNSNVNVEDLQKMTSNATTGKGNNNDITTIDRGQIRKVPGRTLRA